ncbi:aminopeptidase N-like [Galleria mellonella]|uniref:Aminopeptidase N-like n=1 Tax=Galleria mellonella TaxID=7137 RepID=A0A6J1WL81_GALME|nr:aminopeptidase N-like [Galleria mellonella]
MSNVTLRIIRKTIKWKFNMFIFWILLLSVFDKCLATDIITRRIDANNTNSKILEQLNTLQLTAKINITDDVEIAENVDLNNIKRNASKQVRPGQTVRYYSIEIIVNGDKFNGRATLDVRLTTSTSRYPVILHVEDLDIHSVYTGYNNPNFLSDFEVYDGLLEIRPAHSFSDLMILIEYSGSLGSDGRGGIYRGQYGDSTYIAMNLYPTNARRVFPCMDEPTASSDITFSFKNLNYNFILSNSLLENKDPHQFHPLVTPPHLWGVVAHNFLNIAWPISKVFVFGRPGLRNQHELASITISQYYNNLNMWTGKNYFNIQDNQADKLIIIAFPDISKEWYSLSVIGIWEPYICMEYEHSVKQRSIGFIKIAEALSRHWFGYGIYPENWKHEWIVSGLGIYAAWDIFREYQSDLLSTDTSLLDVNSLFVTEIIQESLLRDAYISSQVLQPLDDLFDEMSIRNNINGLIKYKAPAIMRMLRLALGDKDFIQIAARLLLEFRSVNTVNTFRFIDAINSEWIATGNGLIDNMAEFVNSWAQNTGYPTLHVSIRRMGIFVTQERFSFTYQSGVDVIYPVPITYTTSANPNFTSQNTYPQIVMQHVMSINMVLDDNDWVLLNIQGQGYYRVNYDIDLWKRLIAALEDRDTRDVIHPLNRATLVDDALNLARAKKLSYDIAFRVVLTMEHEVEYSAWKAYVRNMDYIRRRLDGAAVNSDHRDSDAYLYILRKVISRFEKEIGFYPIVSNEPAITSLTRGLVMDHACRANYQPCIEAAINWFYEPDSKRTVLNPHIPYDIRPAVYCAVVKEGGDQVLSLLQNRLKIEPTMYERVVILESFGCSQDDAFIKTFLQETIDENSPYSVEERSKIFEAVAKSNYDNIDIALSFITRNIEVIRNKYGGPEKLEEIMYIVADNLVDENQTLYFEQWVYSVNSSLGDSLNAAEKARDLANENFNWVISHIDSIYELLLEIADEDDNGNGNGECSGDEDCEENSGDECDKSSDEDCEGNSGDECDKSSGDEDCEEDSGDECDKSSDEDCEENSGDECDKSSDEDCEENSGDECDKSSDEDCEENSGDECDKSSGDEDCEENSGDECDKSSDEDCEENSGDECDKSSGDEDCEEDNGGKSNESNGTEDCNEIGNENNSNECKTDGGDDAPKLLFSFIMTTLCLSITTFNFYTDV